MRRWPGSRRSGWPPLPLAREHSIDMEFGLQQSVDLARTSVERRRPADASKGYKIVADLLETLE